MEAALQNETNQETAEDQQIRKLSLNSFYRGTKPTLDEIYRFNDYVKYFEDRDVYAFENIHLTKQTSETTVERTTGEMFHMLNMSNYNYLGLSVHPKVIEAAKEALDQYGLGAASAPMIGGTLGIHKELENKLRDFFGNPENGVSLFTTGYNVNVGTISAVMKPGTHIFLDQCVHMSILEGAKLSGATLHHYEHNNVEHLEELVKSVADKNRRMLICTEGVYSADGDYSDIKSIVKIAKQYGAMTMIDEAHSVLVSGENGRGVAEAQGVLDDIDFYVMTFSKAFGGIGGAVIAKKEITRYIDYYARCRMFSCAIGPAVAGGILKSLEIAGSDEGRQLRESIHRNAHYLKDLLKDKVNTLESTSWILPIVYGNEKNTTDINDYLQRHGLEVGLMTFPAVPRGQARIRVFVTAQHTEEQLKKAADIILQAAEKYDFLTEK